MPMPSQQGSNLRPSWPFGHPKIKQKVAYGDWLKKKMLINDVRSWNVYENKQNHDTLSNEKSDIFCRSDVDFAENCRLGRTICRERRLRGALGPEFGD
jgi:hypothetical protein